MHRPSKDRKRNTENISISGDLYRRLKAYAEQQNVTVRAIVEAAVSDIGKGP